MCYNTVQGRIRGIIRLARHSFHATLLYPRLPDLPTRDCWKGASDVVRLSASLIPASGSMQCMCKHLYSWPSVCFCGNNVARCGSKQRERDCEMHWRCVRPLFKNVIKKYMVIGTFYAGHVLGCQFQLSRRRVAVRSCLGLRNIVRARDWVKVNNYLRPRCSGDD